eukprot:m.78542 g.78542  ORF g.78542 m.78542 type:complete len:2951 (-) comp7970_c0_seq2:2704-11556(-)
MLVGILALVVLSSISPGACSLSPASDSTTFSETSNATSVSTCTGGVPILPLDGGGLKARRAEDHPMRASLEPATLHREARAWQACPPTPPNMYISTFAGCNGLMTVETPYNSNFPIPYCCRQGEYANCVWFKNNWATFDRLECAPCQPGSYSPGGYVYGACWECEPGQYQPFTRQTACIGCPIGTYSGATSATSSSTCQACPPGKSCPNSAMRSPFDCSPGMYQPSAGQSSCNYCPPGTYGLAWGQIALSDCLACTPGYYCPNYGVRRACQRGSYQSMSGQTSCIACPRGAFLNNIASPEPCEQCPPGYYQGLTGQTTCIACGKGTYSAGYGATECTVCARGSFQIEIGASACKSCEGVCGRDLPCAPCQRTTGLCPPVTGCLIDEQCYQQGPKPKTGNMTRWEACLSCDPWYPTVWSGAPLDDRCAEVQATEGDMCTYGFACTLAQPETKSSPASYTCQNTLTNGCDTLLEDCTGLAAPQCRVKAIYGTLIYRNASGFGCLVNGTAVALGQPHPSNGCKLCDPHALASAVEPWTSALGRPCDDGDACTYTLLLSGPSSPALYDTCDARAVCRGEHTHTCSVAGSMWCQSASTCSGYGQCDPAYYPAATVCRPAAHACDQAEMCDGVSGFCGPAGGVDVTVPVVITPAQLAFPGSFPSANVDLAYVPSSSSLLLTVVAPFNVSCGELFSRVYMMQTIPNVASCQTRVSELSSVLNGKSDITASDVIACQAIGVASDTFTLNSFGPGNVTLSCPDMQQGVFYAPIALAVSNTSTTIVSRLSTACNTFVMPDATAPVCVLEGFVADLRAANQFYPYYSVPLVQFGTTACTDEASGILGFAGMAGTAPDALDTIVAPSALSLSSAITVNLTTVLVSGELVDGQWIYLTQRATNRAGLTTDIIRLINIDRTAPIVGVLQLTNHTTFSSRLYFEVASDMQSNISSCSFSLCRLQPTGAPALCSGTLLQLAVYAPIKPAAEVTILHPANPIVPGARHNVVATCANQAGLTTTVASNTFVGQNNVIDGAPVGIVRSLDSSQPATLATARSKFLQSWNESDTLHVLWGSFSSLLGPIDSYSVYVVPDGGLIGQSVLQSGLLSVANVSRGGGINGVELHGVGALAHGWKYRVEISAVDSLGSIMQSPAKSDIFFVDLTPAEPPEIINQPSLQLASGHAAFQSSAIAVGVVFKSAREIDSFVTGYNACVGTQPRVCDVAAMAPAAFTSDGGSHLFDLSGPDHQLQFNVSYFITVEVINAAGSLTIAASQPFSYDPTVPSATSAIFDGPEFGIDIDYQTNATSISASWMPFAANISGVSTYLFGIGLCIPIDNLAVQSWTEVPASFGTARGLQLGAGQRYCVKLKAVSGAGVESAVYSSNGVTLVSIPPRGGVVHVGLERVDVAVISTPLTISANWHSFSSQQSVIVDYCLGICSNVDDASSFVDDVIPFICLGNVSRTFNLTLPVPLQNGQHYRLLVRAIDAAGLAVTTASLPFLVAFSSPSNGIISVRGARLDGSDAWVVSDEDDEITWSHFVEPLSFFKYYVISIRRSNDTVVLPPMQTTQLSHPLSVRALGLHWPDHLIVSVIGVNAADKASSASMLRIFFDDSVPGPGSLNTSVVYSVIVAANGQQSLRALVSVAWTGFDEPAGNVTRYVVAIGHSCQADDVSAARTFSGDTSQAVLLADSPLSRAHAVKYVTVSAYNRAGQAAAACAPLPLPSRSSPPTMLQTDWTIPTVPAFADRFAVQSPACVDMDGNALPIAISFVPTASWLPTIQGPTVPPGLNSTVQLEVRDFVAGMFYYALALCRDAHARAASLRSNWFLVRDRNISLLLDADPVYLDDKPLIATWKVAYPQSISALRLFHGISNALTGIANFHESACDVSACVEVTLQSSREMAASSLRLRPGEYYRHILYVEATDSAGVVVNTSTSSTFLVVPSAKPTLTVFIRPDVSVALRVGGCALDCAPLILSTIAQIELGLGTSGLGPDIVSYMTVNVSDSATGLVASLPTTAMLDGVAQEHGSTQYCHTRITLLAGNQWHAVSNGVIIDKTSPIVDATIPLTVSVTQEADGRNYTIKVSGPSCTEDFSRIARYEVCLASVNSLYACNGSNFLALDASANSTEFSISAALDASKTYTVVLRCINSVGAYADSFSDPLIPPQYPMLDFSCNSTSQLYLNHTTIVTRNAILGCSWRLSGRPPADMVVLAGLGTVECDDSITPFVFVTGMEHYDFILDASISSIAVYYSLVMWSALINGPPRCVSQLMYTDLEPPTLPALDQSDGRLYRGTPDGQFTCSFAAPAPDFDTDTARLCWAVSSNGHHDDVMPWDCPDSFSPVFTTQLPQRTLQHLHTYYCICKAVDVAGNTALAAASGVVVDLTAPVAPAFGQNAVTVLDGNTTMIRIPKCIDDESPVTAQGARLLDASGNVINLALVPSTEAYLALLDTSPLNLCNEVIVETTCVNHAGLVATNAMSAVVKFVAPTAEFPENAPLIHYINPAASGSATTWTLVACPTDIVSTAVSIMDENNSIVIINMSPAISSGASTSHDVVLNVSQVATLRPDVPHRATLTLVSMLTGLSTTQRAPNLFVIDASPPVIDGLMQNARPVTTTSLLASVRNLTEMCYFIGRIADNISGVTSVEIALQSSAIGSSTVLAVFQLNTSSAVVILGPQEASGISVELGLTSALARLPHGAQLQCELRATNGAGAISTVKGPVMVVDDTGPVLGWVAPVCRPTPFTAAADTSAPCEYQARDHVECIWRLPTEDVGEVVSTSVCVSSAATPTACDVVPATPSNETTALFNLSAAVADGDGIVCVVNATNTAGLTATGVSSVIYLAAAPVVGRVWDLRCSELGLAHSTDTADADCIAAAWEGFADPDVGLHPLALVGAGSAPGLDDIVRLDVVPYSQGRAMWQLLQPLGEGTTVYVVVIAANRAGMTSSASSDGAVVASASGKMAIRVDSFHPNL